MTNGPQAQSVSASNQTETICFRRIAQAINEYDQPLVHVEDDENGTVVRHRAHINISQRGHGLVPAL